jgi:hypothetical protein
MHSDKKNFNPISNDMIAFITQHLDYPLAAPAEQWEDRDFCLTAITLKRHALRLGVCCAKRNKLLGADRLSLWTSKDCNF